MNETGGPSQWFLGAVIAYATQVKFQVLDVDRGPIITASCAQQMARGVARLTGADFGVGVTGVGGPGTEEDQPAGTVFIALWSAGKDQVEEHHFAGDPTEVIHATTFHALRMLGSEARR